MAGVYTFKRRRVQERRVGEEGKFTTGGTCPRSSFFCDTVAGGGRIKGK